MSSANTLSDGSRRPWRELWREGAAPLFGLFARLTTAEAYEVLALTQINLIVIDVEHGSFDRRVLNQCLAAARSSGLTALVRVPDAGLADVQHAINAGANGIIVPHVAAAAEITEVVRFARGLGIERAWAGAGRASRFRSEPWSRFRHDAARDLTVIAQIDEPPGLKAANDIASVPGLDGIFLGQIGLSLAMEASHPDAVEVNDALAAVCRVCRARGLPIGMSLPNPAEVDGWLAKGVRLFVVDSDYGVLRKGVDSRVSDFRKHLTSQLA